MEHSRIIEVVADVCALEVLRRSPEIGEAHEGDIIKLLSASDKHIDIVMEGVERLLLGNMPESIKLCDDAPGSVSFTVLVDGLRRAVCVDKEPEPGSACL